MRLHLFLAFIYLGQFNLIAQPPIISVDKKDSFVFLIRFRPSAILFWYILRKAIGGLIPKTLSFCHFLIINGQHSHTTENGEVHLTCIAIKGKRRKSIFIKFAH